MHDAFSETGLFSSSRDFEYRPQQQRMAELVGIALEKQQPLVVEAATGVGKSLAYLLPSIRRALDSKRKAVITTHTINLQEQLIHKDIPIIQKLVGDFKAVLLKGRSNYLCPTRLKRALAETGDLFTAFEAAELTKLLEWSESTRDGTLSDLTFSPTARVWSMVCSEAHACTPRKCGPGSNCWYQSARRKVAEADVVVMNHTLFFTLLSSNEETLPEDGNFLFPRDFVILDEAHTIENIAAKAFGTCGVVLGDEKLVARSRQLIAHAITLRDQEGVFVENGGRDSSYNVVSILFGSVLALHVPLPEFEAILPAAVAWQLTRVLPSGEVDVKGNTRTGVGKEANAFGTAKTVNYKEVVLALTIYGLVHRDQTALAAADRVFAFSERTGQTTK
jgi:hypothetical protein